MSIPLRSHLLHQLMTVKRDLLVSLDGCMRTAYQELLRMSGLRSKTLEANLAYQLPTPSKREAIVLPFRDLIMHLPHFDYGHLDRKLSCRTWQFYSFEQGLGANALKRHKPLDNRGSWPMSSLMDCHCKLPHELLRASHSFQWWCIWAIKDSNQGLQSIGRSPSRHPPSLPSTLLLNTNSPFSN